MNCLSSSLASVAEPLFDLSMSFDGETPQANRTVSEVNELYSTPKSANGDAAQTSGGKISKPSTERKRKVWYSVSVFSHLYSYLFRFVQLEHQNTVRFIQLLHQNFGSICPFIALKHCLANFEHFWNSFCFWYFMFYLSPTFYVF